MNKNLKIWAITNGTQGADTQCRGISTYLPGNMDLFHVAPACPWRWFAPFAPAMMNARTDSRFQNAWPDMVISVGRAPVPYARYIRKISKGKSFCVHLQHPHISPKYFDFIWAPLHDKIEGENIYKTLLSPHDIQAKDIKRAAQNLSFPTRKQGQSCAAILIGGPSNAYPFSITEMKQLAAKLAQIAAQDIFCIITLSRRSPAAFAHLLREALTPFDYYLWDGTGDNPYPALLGVADYVLTTEDSVNMTGEACIAGKPVYVFPLKGGKRKFHDFHTTLQERGMTRRFTGTLAPYPTQSYNDTPHIANKIMHAFETHIKGRV